MPKPKQTTKAKRPKQKSAPVKKTKAPSSKAKVVEERYTDEYVEYLERYELYGAGRRRLSPAEFDRLDDEMLDLLALEAEHGLNDEQIVRLQELEYLLLDSEQ
jgi:hypothetical protein